MILSAQVLQYHQPPQRRLPPLVFVRLRDAMGDYITERASGGATVVRGTGLAPALCVPFVFVTAGYLRPAVPCA